MCIAVEALRLASCGASSSKWLYLWWLSHSQWSIQPNGRAYFSGQRCHQWSFWMVRFINVYPINRSHLNNGTSIYVDFPFNSLVAGGIYQNSVYGMAAKLPFKYTGAVVLGSNISGTLTSIISILTSFFASSVKTAAIYYFIGAMFVLLACFDTYFALPLNVSLTMRSQIEKNPLINTFLVGTEILSISRTYARKGGEEEQKTWWRCHSPAAIFLHFPKGISTIIQRFLCIFHHTEPLPQCAIW